MTSKINLVLALQQIENISNLEKITTRHFLPHIFCPSSLRLKDKLYCIIMEKKLYDDCFYVERKKYGLWDSTNLEGKGLITSLTEEECVRATRFYLKGLQEGWSNDTIKYEGTVGGKL